VLPNSPCYSIISQTIKKRGAITIAPDESDQKYMTMMEHLAELGSRLKIIIIALVITCSIGWLPADPAGFLDPVRQYRPIVSLILLQMRSTFLPKEATLIAGGLVDTIFVYMYLSILMGLVLSSPIIAYEIYEFIKPGLYPHERKHISAYMLSFIGLFTFGLAMAYFLIIPLTYKILIWFIMTGGAVPFINIKDFYNWSLTLLLISAIFYTVPLYVVILAQFGLLPTGWLSGRKKVAAYVILWLVLWVITPDPTPITGTIILAPFIAFFEVAIWAARRIDRGRTGRPTEAPKVPKLEAGYPKCKFCGGSISSSPFCATCGRSQV
jgi:sec-independent protein translocase protein TatC